MSSDQTAKLAKQLADESIPFLFTDKGKQELYPMAGIHVDAYADRIAFLLGRWLAERDERGTNERLAEIIQTMQRWCDDSGYTNLPYFIDESLSLHRELQSRRAAEQAALPAVEEMAGKIAERVYECIERLRAYEVPDVKSVTIELLAPLYARIADLEQRLARNQQFVADQNKAIAEREILLSSLRDFTTHVLRECSGRNVLAGIAAEARDMSGRIDALLGAKGRK